MAFKRVLPWVTAAVGTLILLLLMRSLSRYDWGEVLQSLRRVDRYGLGLAIAAAAGSYATLTLFDTLALRYVGARVPYRRIAWASFSSLALGHNIGFAALSSGAIRYRFYSREGLSVEQVGKVIVFCAFTVGLGLMALGGAACLVHPDLAGRVLRLGPSAASALGAACMALLLAWLLLATFARRPLRIRSWRIQAPPPRLAAAQIAVGATNFAFVAGALYFSLRTVADVEYFSTAAVYVIGNVAALISHVPGGLGVIESTVLYLMPQDNLLGALVLFRIVYFLLPLPLGALLLAAAELRARRRPAPRGCGGASPSRA